MKKQSSQEKAAPSQKSQPTAKPKKPKAKEVVKEDVNPDIEKVKPSIKKITSKEISKEKEKPKPKKSSQDVEKPTAKPKKTTKKAPNAQEKTPNTPNTPNVETKQENSNISTYQHTTRTKKRTSLPDFFNITGDVMSEDTFHNIMTEPQVKTMQHRIADSYQLMLDYLQFKGPLHFAFETYENWFTNILPRQLRNSPIDLKDGTFIILEFETLTKPTKKENGKAVPLYPRIAFLENYNYVGQLYISILHYKNIGDSKRRLLTKKEGVPFFELPVMVNSKACHLRDMSPEEKLKAGSDPNDPGGYFILVPTARQMNHEPRIAKSVFLLNKDSMMHNTDQLFREDKGVVSKITISTTKGTQQITVLYDQHNVLHARVGLKQDTANKKPRTVNLFIVFFLLDRLMGNEFDMDATIQLITSMTKEENRRAIRDTLAPTKGHFMTYNNPIKFFSEQLGVGNEALYEEESLNHVRNVVFPTTQSIQKRKIELSLLTVRLLEYMIGKRNLDDRDHWGNKRIDTPGFLIQTLFNTLFIRVVRDIKSVLGQRTIDIDNIERACINTFRTNLTDAFHISFTGARWGPPGSYRSSAQYAEPMPTDGTPITVYSLISGIKKPINNQGKVEPKVRHIKDSQKGYAGLEDSPEGKIIGIKLFFSLLASVSLEWDPELVMFHLQNNPKLQVKEERDEIYNRKIIFNGIFLGWGRGFLMEKTLRKMKQRAIVPKDIRIYESEADETLYLDSNGGRPIRPLLVIKNNELVIDKKNLWNKPMSEIIESGAIEMIDPMEQSQENFVVSYSIENFKNRRRINNDLRSKLEMIKNRTYVGTGIPNYNGYFDMSTNEDVQKTIENLELVIQRDDHEINFRYCEINPNGLMSYTGALAAYADRNPIPRVTYQANMGRQAVGRVSNVQHLLFDRSTMEIIPTGSYEQTPIEGFLRQDEHSPHQPVILAILPEDNQEDAYEINGSSVDRGMLNFYEYYSSKDAESSIGNNIVKRISYPNLEKIPEHKRKYYRNLDNNGIVRLRSIVSDGDVLISSFRENTLNKVMKDVSIVVKKGEGGVVDSIHTYVDASGHKIVSVKVRQARRPIEGDKFQLGNAQKGTVGRIRREEDMPWVYAGLKELLGMKPDVIINPHAYPSRMTIGAVLEQLAALIGVETGTEMDVSSFQEELTLERLLVALTRLGWINKGYAKMASGITGKPFGRPHDTEIKMTDEEKLGVPAGSGLVFMLPISYRQLKHVTHKKMHGRGIGGKKMDTRQPVGGRQRDGGSRFGRMESDVFVGHGVFANLADRLCHSSDAFESVVCTSCGKFALVDHNNRRFKCTLCNKSHEYEGFGRTTTPYITTNVTHHLAAAGINFQMVITPNVPNKIYGQGYDDTGDL